MTRVVYYRGWGAVVTTAPARRPRAVTYTEYWVAPTGAGVAPGPRRIPVEVRSAPAWTEAPSRGLDRLRGWGRGLARRVRAFLDPDAVGR